MNQLLATGITWGIAIVGSFVLLKLIDLIVGLRVTAAEEAEGHDITQRGESGYNFEDVYSGATLGSDSPAPAAAAHGMSHTSMTTASVM